MSQFILLQVLVLGMLFVLRACGLTVNGNMASEVEAAKGDIVRQQFLVDGDRFPKSSQCFQLDDNDPTLYVRLTTDVDVSFVLMYADASDYVYRDALRGIQVYVGNELCYEDNINTRERGHMAEVLTAVCDTPIQGSVVKIRLPGRNRTLRLCEVEVYDTTCNCLEGCNTDEVFCLADCPRYPCTRENQALFQPANSSQLIDISGPPSVVVNGNTGTTFISDTATSDEDEQNCIVSKARTSVTWNSTLTATWNSTLSANERKKRTTSAEQYVTPWWSVDLEPDVPVRGVVIYRANPAQVWKLETLTEITVDGETCAKYGPETHPEEEALRERLVVMCDRVIRGREVMISRVKVSRTFDPAPLHLCEVQIWSCEAGWYGEDCSKKCGHCLGGRDTCDAETGLCADGCAAGWYGSTCKRRCDCLGGHCEQDTGYCLLCPPNYALPDCSGCEAGWYGEDCSKKCGHCLGGRDTCDAETGLCADECIDGWYGRTCSDECGQCLYGQPCDHITGHCPAGCEAGYLPPFCVDFEEFSTMDYSTTATTPINSNSIGDDGNNTGVIVGAVVGVLAVVVVIFIVVFIWYRRRRGGLGTEKNTAAVVTHAGPKVYMRNEKPEATKTDSAPYTDAMSPTAGHSDVINDADDDAVYAVIDEALCYESLEGLSYDNTATNEYTKPVFRRGDSKVSNASGAYVNMGATT